MSPVLPETLGCPTPRGAWMHLPGGLCKFPQPAWPVWTLTGLGQPLAQLGQDLSQTESRQLVHPWSLCASAKSLSLGSETHGWPTTREAGGRVGRQQSHKCAPRRKPRVTYSVIEFASASHRDPEVHRDSRSSRTLPSLSPRLSTREGL